MSVVWVAYPKWRWVCVLACGSVVVGLVGMDYHFVGDVVAGAFLGSVTGMYASHFFRLDQGSARSSDPAVLPCPPPTDAKKTPPDLSSGGARMNGTAGREQSQSGRDESCTLRAAS
jgi:hypothetical protein